MTKRPNYPVVVFVLFWCSLLAATALYAPGWGFMDDYGNIGLAQRFWSGHGWRVLAEHVRLDIHNDGRFRPIYQLWIVLAYGLGKMLSPTVVYILIELVGMAAMLLWGKVIADSFHVKEEERAFTVYLFPLTFFLFTPFWNNFMYLSVQEKFITFISPAAILCFLLSYRTNRSLYVWLAFGCGALCLLSKETGIALIGAFAGVALVDLISTRANTRMSWRYSVAGAMVVAGYFVLIRRGLHGYTQSYKGRMNLLSVIHGVGQSPPVIKALFALGVAWSIVVLMRAVRGKRGALPELLVFPFFLVAYLLVLSPWKFVNYLLAPLAPMVVILLFPVCLWGLRANGWLRRSTLGLVTVGIVGVLVLVIVPRVSKMADKQETVAAVRDLGGQGSARFFFPPPFSESAHALGGFSGQEVTYLERGVLSKTELGRAGNYLIVSDQCGSVELEDVMVGEEVYRNGTWRIFRVRAQDGQHRAFAVEFRRSVLYRLKQQIGS